MAVPETCITFATDITKSRKDEAIYGVLLTGNIQSITIHVESKQFTLQAVPIYIRKFKDRIEISLRIHCIS